ncbi:MAG: hypothetical protein NT040_18175 [Bacteroidetes bacterium]|nr:hypothetical protein [Bacteroidota bacterium]
MNRILFCLLVIVSLPFGQLVEKILNEQGAKMSKAFLIKEIAETEEEKLEKFLFGMR